MIMTAGIDVGSTYTKVALLGNGTELVGTAQLRTGFRLEAAAAEAFEQALAQAGCRRDDVAYICTTGSGRNMVQFRDVQVTDLTAQARGARFFFPATRTVLDIGGQTMKAVRLDDNGRVRSFRLNDKCAAGTGAFLEKTARYLEHNLEEIGPLVSASQKSVPISGVCAVFAESEVINHISNGESPGDIMHGAMRSLVQRAAQLLKRVQMEPEITLVGGILRFARMAELVREQLKTEVNVPSDHYAQFTAAIGAAALAQRRLEKLQLQDQLA